MFLARRLIQNAFFLREGRRQRAQSWLRHDEFNPVADVSLQVLYVWMRPSKGA